MTENRFTLKKFLSNEYGLLDDEKEIAYVSHKSAFTICDLLNCLNDENEQLKARIEYLERKIQRERNSTQKQYEKWEKEALEKINKLEKENAFLTVEVEALKQIKPIKKLPQKLTILKLDDDVMTTKDCFNCVYAQSNEDGINCYRETKKRVKGTDICEYYKKIGDVE